MIKRNHIKIKKLQKNNKEKIQKRRKWRDIETFNIKKMILTQDIMNGNWTKNNQTKLLIDLN